jgi:hypothetical protein
MRRKDPLARDFFSLPTAQHQEAISLIIERFKLDPKRLRWALMPRPTGGSGSTLQTTRADRPAFCRTSLSPAAVKLNVYLRVRIRGKRELTAPSERRVEALFRNQGANGAHALGIPWRGPKLIEMSRPSIIRDDRHCVARAPLRRRT